MSLGQGVRSVYARILFALTIGEHAGEIWTLETAGYRLFIFCASQGMVINGFSVSYSWLTEVLLEQMLSPSSNHPIGAEKTLTPEEANDVINDDILDGATYDGIHDNVEQWTKVGDYNDVLDDFSKLIPNEDMEVPDQDQEKWDPKRPEFMGKLSDDRTVIAREHSSDLSGDHPTLEIQKKVPDVHGKPKTTYQKIRYVSKGDGA